MQLEHEFTVPVPPEQAWPVLLDIERIAPCMPGATLTEVDGRDFDGKVKVKVGPIQVTYSGHASFTEVDEDAHRAVIEAKGKETRGAGTAAATITAQLHPEEDFTLVSVVTDLAITGRPAQFGRGVMADVGGKLLDRFARCLADTLGAEQEPAPAQPAATEPAPQPAAAPAESAADAAAESAPAVVPPAATAPSAAAVTASSGPPQPAAASKSRPPAPARENEPIDLLDVAGGSVAKRLAPIVAGVVAVVALVLWRRRRR